MFSIRLPVPGIFALLAADGLDHAVADGHVLDEAGLVGLSQSLG